MGRDADRRAATRAAILGVLVGATACNGLFERPISGQVVTIDGQPLDGAVVLLVHQSYPPGGRGIEARQRTDERGGFVFRDVDREGEHDLVVQHGGLERTFHTHNDARTGLRVRLSPTVELPIHLRCATPSASNDRYPQVRISWGPHEVWYSGVIPAERQLPQVADLVPTGNIVSEMLEAGVRDHALRVPVPIGEVQLEVFDRCGTYRETIVVERGTDELAPLRFVQGATPAR